MSVKTLFNADWKFVKTPFGTKPEQLTEYEEQYKPVDIPHDFLIWDTLNLYETSTGFYKKTFALKKEADKKYEIYFEGVYMDSRVYVNGELAGEWKYGYSSFGFDISALLTDGENTVLVQVDHHAPNSRWYSGAGIFRDVYFIVSSRECLTRDGIYVVSRKQGEDYLVQIEAEVEGFTTLPEAKVVLKHDNDVIKETMIRSAGRFCAYNGHPLLEGSIPVEKPLLWDHENPNLYTLEVILPNGDSEEVTIGFRDFVFDPAKGFFVNGKFVKLHGVCEHHDLGALGAAFNKAAMRRKIKNLKAMGVNAIRTSHNMPAKGLMELADEMGMYIDSEGFDMWMEPKTEYDYARFFDEWAEKDVASWIRRDRNHASVIMWSIGNEIHDTHEAVGVELTKRLMNAVRVHDPKENARVTIGSNYMPWQGAQNCADIVKVAGYNYADNHYDEHHEKHPDWVIYGSETSSIVQSRGIYHFPAGEPVLTEEDEQCSSLGNSRPSWAAKTVEHCIAVDRDRDFATGQFLWTGHDYIGEPTPYKTKNSYFGQIDTAGFPKDAFYMYQAEWTDVKKAPMVHLFPYWDFNEGQLVDIRVCSNASWVEVFVNGCSLGKVSIDHTKGENMFPTFMVPYEKGEIKALAYDEEGRVIAEDVHHSFGDSAKIVLNADKTEMNADGLDMIFVEISTVDRDGYPVENAMDYVEVCVSGAGRLVGLDNGDSTDYDSYKGCVRKLFNGKLLAMIAAKDVPGEIKVEVKEAFGGHTLEAAVLSLTAKKCEVPEGISCKEENGQNAVSGRNEENKDLGLVTGKAGLVPVRKIELVSEDGQEFDENKKEIIVKAYIYPENATDREVCFTATNDAGIVSHLADIAMLPVEEGDLAAAKCLVKAKGDGRFRLRATGKNKTDTVRIMSALEFKASGIGQAYLDPYGFIAGALYNRSFGDVGTFSEKSAATAQEGESLLIYDNIDFGDFGADEITLPIFAQSGDPHYLQIWEGVPGEEGSEMLADVVYQKPSTWDVYKPETYKLKRRIRGIQTLCLKACNQRYFIKGFSFKRPVKAFEKLYATEYQNLYGDTFTIQLGENGARSGEDCEITGIGNNVSLQFDDMDFGKEGTSKVTICGRSKLAKNTIHIRFFLENGVSYNQIVEFEGSGEYVERTFPIDRMEGKTKVEFLFLPGCDFDFKYFRFA